MDIYGYAHHSWRCRGGTYALLCNLCLLEVPRKKKIRADVKLSKVLLIFCQV